MQIEWRVCKVANDIIIYVETHRFFQGLKSEYMQALAQCAHLKIYAENEMLGQEGTPSDYFFALLKGRVAIETYQPGHKPFVLQTLHGGEVVGWSWLFPPYEWVFDARALTSVQTLAFDALCLREKLEENPSLGFELVKRFAQVMTLRLKATRLQLLDMFGKKNPGNSHE